MTVFGNAFGAIGDLLGAGGSAPSGTAPDVVPATLPAWAVEFLVDDGPQAGQSAVIIGSDDYDGSVTATLPQGLSGGTYRIVVEGLDDDDYAKLRVPGQTLQATIHLWWRDSPSGVAGDLRRLVGAGEALDPVRPTPPEHSQVAVIRVDSVRRQAGERRYDTVITGRERVYARLQDTRVGGLAHRSLDEAAQALGVAAGVPVLTHGLRGLPAPSPDNGLPVSYRDGTALEAMTGVGEQARTVLRLSGPSVAVIRDDVLHLGRWSAADGLEAPVGTDRTLDEDHGLLSVGRGADDDGPVLAAGQEAPAPRPTVTATALGRPDVKIGDVVAIPLPPEDFPAHIPDPGWPLLTEIAGLFGSSRGNAPEPSRCLVTEVSHRLSARQGFVTTVRATVLRDPTDDGWTPVAASATGRSAALDGDGPGRGSIPADHASGAAGAVRGVAHAIARRVQGARFLAGEIRAHKGSPALQTLADVYYATEEDLQQPGGLRSAPIAHDRPNQRADVPAVTPFAFGGFGLVLPRYPGTRVLLGDTGNGRDVVDLGALWAPGTSPPAQPGDWWLLLPIGLPTNDPAPQETRNASGVDASHDLIDSSGRRLVETSSLVLRVTDQPTSNADRPPPGDAGNVVVECIHGGTTARITIDANGGITLSGTSIALDAGDGDITLNAKNVAVTVSGTMDVS